uniref:Uncharacterized protein n=1 Tax=Anguilla anguilla TaxID=7936 RepID=A0A0E9W111_ANGAN
MQPKTAGNRSESLEVFGEPLCTEAAIGDGAPAQRRAPSGQTT